MYETMFILFAFSFLVVSSPLLRANNIVASWLDQIESSIFGGIFQLAYYSPKEALTVLIKYFGYIGVGTALFQSFLIEKFGVGNNILIISSCCMVYGSFSLHTWMIKRKEVVNKIKDDFIQGVKSTTIWSMILFIVTFIGYTAVQLEINPNYLPEFHVLGYFLLLTLFTVSLSLGVISIFFYLLLFIPAFLIIIYIVSVVHIAKFLAKSSRSSIKYTCNIYFVVFSLYTIILTYKSLT